MYFGSVDLFVCDAARGDGVGFMMMGGSYDLKQVH